MPGQNQVIGSLNEYVTILELQLQDLKNRVDLIAPTSGGGSVRNGDLDMHSNSIINTTNIGMNGAITGAASIDRDTAGVITLAGTIATQLTLARAAVPVICPGIFSSVVPQGAWYSTTTYNPAFSAGVNRLTPPTAATAGTLVEFTHALGVLTYTGTRTRPFTIRYNITFLSGASGSSMTLFNSINGSTVIGTQTRVRKQIDTTCDLIFSTMNFDDNIVLSTGQTVQLAGACAILSSGVGYQFVSCNVMGALG